MAANIAKLNAMRRAAQKGRAKPEEPGEREDPNETAAQEADEDSEETGQ